LCPKHCMKIFFAPTLTIVFCHPVNILLYVSKKKTRNVSHILPYSARSKSESAWQNNMKIKLRQRDFGN
jgi:hypothetical protein